MGENHYRKFIKTIRNMSVHPDEWKEEWLPNNQLVEMEGFCICGKDILYHCGVSNKLNGKSIFVGTDCYVTHFGFPFPCRGCQTPLANKARRIKEKNYYCRSCTKKNKEVKQNRITVLSYYIYKANYKYLSEFSLGDLKILAESTLTDPCTTKLREYYSLITS